MEGKITKAVTAVMGPGVIAVYGVSYDSFTKSYLIPIVGTRKVTLEELMKLAITLQLEPDALTLHATSGETRDTLLFISFKV
jgi:hypothetical protein